MRRIKKSEIRPRVFLLEFASQYELASTFLRFQEHYESRRFRSKIFTLEQYMDWYAGEFGNFTYYEDWAGFNIPSSALAPFYEGKFDPLQEKEKRLLKIFRREKKPFYVIGLVADDKEAGALEHELAHACFHTDPDYRRSVLGLLRDYDVRAVKDELLRLGYCRQVLDDEVHAYVLAGGDFLKKSTRRRLAPLRRGLRRLFREAAAED